MFLILKNLRRCPALHILILMRNCDVSDSDVMQQAADRKIKKQLLIKLQLFGDQQGKQRDHDRMLIQICLPRFKIVYNIFRNVLDFTHKLICDHFKFFY